MDLTSGMVYLVGAGPGAPGLITVRGAQCLRRADLILYDYLVDPRILRHASAHAEKVCLGRHGTGRIMSQEEVNQRMVEAARQGKAVVRLKGGDPTLFARAAEELAVLHEAGLPFEVVPGVSAALAVGSYAGIPLTHRLTSSCVALVTGQETPHKATEPLDYAALAKFPGTLVFYMGVTTAPTWSRSLVEGGLAAATPVAIVRHCTWPEQQVWRCRLDEAAQIIEGEGIRPPALIVVGEVAKTSHYDWFAARPLYGQTILVTRPVHQAAEMEQMLAEQGARVLLQPAIAIEPPESWAAVDDAIERLSDFDWVVFSSANGVASFLDRVLQTGRDLRILGSTRIASIGPATAQSLEARGLRPDVMPEEYRAESLADALAAGAASKRFLLIRASRGREVLADQLRDAGGDVEQVVVYQSRDIAAPDPDVQTELEEGRVDWVTATSSAIARSLVKLFGEALRRTKLAAISPVTAATLEGLGYPAELVAHEYTTPGMVDAILGSRPQRKQAEEH